MSEKRAKEKRKEQEKPLYQVLITISKNGDVNVQGFPDNVAAANDFISKANLALWGYFINEAAAGRVDNRGNVIRTKIEVPSPAQIQKVVGKTE